MRDLNRGRPEAASAIWSPEARAPEATARPPGRARGLLQGAVSGGLGLLFWWLGWRVLAGVAWTLGGVVAVAALLSPGLAYVAIERLFAAAGRALGGALTWLVLPPMFYLVFYPFGLLLRRGRRDRLSRFYEPSAPTYWEKVAPTATSPASHERQY